ncbi:MAG TPA: aminotransferase DegT, partial [Solirubrobacterales bacterium]|nr:aminotransferase DegT [Solirubrobacterales bacterium]
MTKFAIGFDHRDRPRLFELWTEVLDSEQWSEGAKLAAFEERWAEWNKLPSVGLSSWAGGALAALEFAGVKGETVLC